MEEILKWLTFLSSSPRKHSRRKRVTSYLYCNTCADWSKVTPSLNPWNESSDWLSHTPNLLGDWLRVSAGRFHELLPDVWVIETALSETNLPLEEWTTQFKEFIMYADGIWKQFISLIRKIFIEQTHFRSDLITPCPFPSQFGDKPVDGARVRCQWLCCHLA